MFITIETDRRRINIKPWLFQNRINGRRTWRAGWLWFAVSYIPVPFDVLTTLIEDGYVSFKLL